MPRPATYRSPYIRQYLREALPEDSWAQSRGHLNRWIAFLQERTCSDTCCEHRSPEPISLQAATRQEAVDYGYHLKHQGRAQATINDVNVKVRAYYTWAVAADLNDGNPNPFNGIKNKAVVKRILPNVAPDVVEKVIKAQDNKKGEKRDKHLIARDKAILAVLEASGMRRAEVCRLDLKHYMRSDDRPLLLLVDPKNDEERIAPLSYQAALLIDRYLLFRGLEDGPLFPSQRRGRLTPAGISQMFDRCCKRAGVETKYGVHAFRRGFSIQAKKAGLDVDTIMAIQGWKNVQQYRDYTRGYHTELALDEYFAKMAGEKPAKGRGTRPNRYGRKAA